jgi:hypothetical protein
MRWRRYFKGFLQDGGQADFSQKPLQLALKGLSIEATFSQTHFAGQYSAIKGSLFANL